MKLTPRYTNERGHESNEWLTSFHSFSFGDYYDENHIAFGSLRVLNDDHIEAGGGFPPHPHRDMEIFTIPLLGNLSHEDSTGTSSTIGRGDIQIMSAGTGVVHSEFNGSEIEPVELLQIWIIPHTKNLKPRYEERHFPYYEEKNQLHTVITPDGRGGSLKIFQDAYVSIGVWDKEDKTNYEAKNREHAVYLFCIEGEVTLGGYTLKRRDALAIVDSPHFLFNVKERTTVLFIEVPYGTSAKI